MSKADDELKSVMVRDGCVSKEDADRILRAVKFEVGCRLMKRELSRQYVDFIRGEIRRQITHPLASIVAGAIARDVGERRSQARARMQEAVRQDVERYKAIIESKGGSNPMIACDVCEQPSVEVWVVAQSGRERNICNDCHADPKKWVEPRICTEAAAPPGQRLYNALWLAAAAAITAAGLVALFLS